MYVFKLYGKPQLVYTQCKISANGKGLGEGGDKKDGNSN